MARVALNLRDRPPLLWGIGVSLSQSPRSPRAREDSDLLHSRSRMFMPFYRHWDLCSLHHLSKGTQPINGRTRM